MHCSFGTRFEAERAYVLAYALGSVHVLKRCRDPSTSTPAPATPMPESMLEAWAEVADDFLESEWHVVFKGKTPGVYPTW